MTVDRRWVLLGAGGHSRSIADVLARLGDEVVGSAGTGPGAGPGAVADDASTVARAVRDRLLVGLAVGDNRARLRLLGVAVAAGADLATIEAATSTVAPGASLGAGTVVLEHAHVGPGAVVGRAVVVNTAAVVEHDAVVADGAHVAPGACVLGGARVGEATLVGAGATVLPGVTVGAGVTVAAGAVVVSDVADGSTVIGVPARVRARSTVAEERSR